VPFCGGVFYKEGVRVFPSEQEFVGLAEKGNLIPVYTTLMADCETPVSAYSKLRGQAPSFLLESIEGGERISRYSFAGSRPRKVIAAYEERTLITDAEGQTQEVPTPADPLTLVEEEMRRHQWVELPGLPVFTGGAVGFLGHEYVCRVEPTVPTAAQDTLGMPLLYYIFADTVVAFDHARQVLTLIANASIAEGEDPRAAYKRAVKELETLQQTLAQPAQVAVAPLDTDIPMTVPQGNFTREAFEAMVERVKEYIRAGDVIQVVASQRFEHAYGGSALDLYRALRIINPSPYMFALECPEFSIVGASPEVHVRETAGRVEIRPIAGTRPRGATEEEDLINEHELLADEKERAEHLMLVDLARNDIGRVCEIGSVEVKDYAIIERYSHVMHIVSQVEGTLAPDKTSFDLMRVTFPAGTLSGAPKVRALQIISEQEGSRRGSYGGALGYFGYNGNLDSCILIRTALLKDGKLHIQSGAGLVADSVPANEYDETINKAKGMLKAVGLAERIAGTHG